MRDAWPSELRDALDRERALCEVDGHGISLPRRRQCRRLTGRVDEREQVRPRDLAKIQAAENDVPELKKARAEPVATGLLHVLDEATCNEGREQPGDCARVDAGPSRDLVRSELGVHLRESVDDGECALHRADEPDRWLSSPRHDRANNKGLPVCLMATASRPEQRPEAARCPQSPKP